MSRMSEIDIMRQEDNAQVVDGHYLFKCAHCGNWFEYFGDNELVLSQPLCEDCSIIQEWR